MARFNFWGGFWQVFWLIGFLASLYTLIVIVSAAFLPAQSEGYGTYSETAKLMNKIVGDTTLRKVIDAETGCEYLLTAAGAITPRLASHEGQAFVICIEPEGVTNEK